MPDINFTLEKIQTTKDYLAEDRFKVKLHDLVANEIKNVLSETSTASYNEAWSVDEFNKRLSLYEIACRDLQAIQALMGFWGKEDQRTVLVLPPKRLSGDIRPKSGITIWLSLQWYPAMLLLYAGGIAAVAANSYENLHSLISISAPDYSQPSQRNRLILAIGSAAAKLHEAFKALPGHETQYLPRSEYLYEMFRPVMDDLFLLGSDYEIAFDRFEALLALEHAYLLSMQGGKPWGPPGRFFRKFRDGSGSNPLADMLAEAQMGPDWPILRAGFFGGSTEKFKEVLSQYRQRIASSSW